MSVTRRLRRAIIVGIDDTLLEGVDEKPVAPVLEVIRSWRSYSYGHVLFVTAREESCYVKTAKWLDCIGLPPWDSVGCRLLMRPTGDTRPDDIVKYEIYEREIAEKYNVRFAIEDQKSVVKMWRDLGIYVFDVGKE